MPDLSGIQYVLFAGLGALIGLAVSAVIGVFAIFFPELWPWVFVPVGVGAVVGFGAAIFIK